MATQGRPPNRGKIAVSQLVLNFADVNSFDAVLDCLEARSKVVKELKGIAREIGSEVEQFYVLPLIHELQYYPPRVRRKINWTSDKQRKYVMALLRRQAAERGTPDDIGYRRTNALREGWKYQVTVVAGKTGVIRVRVWNDAEQIDPFTGRKRHYAMFVGGKIGMVEKRLREYEKPMQRFHKEGGWNQFAPRVVLASQYMRNYAVEQYRYRSAELIANACI